jgi:lysylphosphatidylglycerol synthetase-like protein (DUF2156 family)
MLWLRKRRSYTLILSSGRLTPASVDTPTRNDILASNLLFAALGLLILFQVAGWLSQALALPHNYFSPVHFNLLTLAGLGLTSLIRGGLAYAVRRGAPAAKLLLALGFVVSLYTTTYWKENVVAGVNFVHFDMASLLLLLTGMLTLAALVAMFWPARESARLV